ncbi:MAG: putative toxin-antitoxin system toxin component, PIN family [Bacteroidetes bacterium]|nr:putative toxin-antitoxin system toxin component, PIN family [Bacteroidota bacterium]
MQKIVIDTNVIVSALIQKSYPYLIINELYLEDRFELCISDELMTEYYDVLTRPKFAMYQDFFILAKALLAAIEIKGTKYLPAIKLDLVKDKDDNKILELADESSADFIITGNKNDFSFENYKTTKIVTHKDF